jgi:hypothetical protein
VVAVVVVVAGTVVSATTTAVAIVAVAAEGSTAELVSSVTDEVTADAPPTAANSNTRSARGTGEVASAAESPRPAALPSELVSLAGEIGQAWSQTYVRNLQAQERDIVGAWPGTIREARRQVLARIKTKLEPEQLDQLAKMTNLAARRGWESVSEPDLES